MNGTVTHTYVRVMYAVPYSFDYVHIFLTAPSIVPNVSITETVESGKTTSVNVTWTTPKSDVNITEYQVQYRKNGTDLWNNATVVSGSPPPTFVVLTGLDPGTEYAIRVRAVSAVGVVGFWHYGTVRTMDGKFYAVSAVVM